MKTKLFFAFAAFCCLFLAYGTYQGLVVAPTEETMGDVQRIFYVHVPAATVGFTLFFVNFCASIVYLWKRSPKADALAATAAEVGIVFCTVVLITGPIWARYAWGVWWSPWDMRLNTTLMLWLLYVSYLILRRSSTAGSTSVLASSMAIFAFLDVPIVYMANRWFRTHHPAPMIGTPNLDHRMQNILFINMLAFLCFGALICWFRYEMERTAQKIDSAHIQKAAGGAAGMMLLPAIFFATPGHVNPHVYLWGGYLAAWGIYLSYLLFLMSKLGRLKKEAAELRAE
ncbi:MAG TPA: cytochrome c biogenesis protein CcsA [Candidatus Angelobacter sp.]|jgi:heme exporter protein C